MTTSIKIFFLTFVFMITAVLPLRAEVTVGGPAPEFTATDINGQEQSLSAYKGKFVVLEWFNFNCPFIRKHYDSGNMQALQKEYTAKGVVWLSICSSAEGKQGFYSPEELGDMARERGSYATAVIRDADGTLGRMYGAQTTPHMFVIDPAGTLIYQGAIDSVPGADQPEIAEAQNYVAAALQAAMAGEPVEVSSTKSYGCSVKY